MGSAVARVVQLASSDDQVVRDLSYLVLSDVALTQKVLRLANSVKYRSVSGGQVTTVSRAIFLLGFETVKTTALTMLLVERLADLKHSDAVSTELKRAVCASIIGREMARSSRRHAAEETAIAALFANVGHIMVAAYDYPRYAEIRALVDGGQMPEEQAAMCVLGYTFATLSQSILRLWKIPETIIQGVESLPEGVPKPAKTPREWMQQIAAFSTEATNIVLPHADTHAAQDKDRLLARFGAALNIDSDVLDGLMHTVNLELLALCEIADLSILDAARNDGEADQEKPQIPTQLLMQGEERTMDALVKDLHPSGKPIHAKDLLLQGVQELMQMSAGGQARANDIMLLVLETLFNSMGFRFATICLKDKKSNEYRARLTAGDHLQGRKSEFAFAADGKDDLFTLSMESDADLMIADASDAKIRDLLPAWHRHLLPDARSFMILPIVVAQKQLGFFYGDRSLPAPEGVPADEAALIKLLKTQLLQALNKLRS